jgi:hypothetical protein
MSLAFPWWERAGGNCQWDDIKPRSGAYRGAEGPRPRPCPSRPGRAVGGPVRSAVGTGSWDLNASATELQTRSPLELDLAAL